MSDWDPGQYLQFRKDRLRPVHDLVRRIEHLTPETVIDLGCGPGTSTRILGEQYSQAIITGVDNSKPMIDKARQYYPAANYDVVDANTWMPEKPVDLMFSNAVFHWLPDHEGLLSRLATGLKKGGTLAVQIPDNMAEPSHRAINVIAGSAEFAELLTPRLSLRIELATIGQYYQWLRRNFAQVDIWRTTYAHILPSHQHIVEWMKGAALTPFLDVLDETLQEQFLNAYLEEIVKSYPVQSDGTVMFHFPRLFIVSHKS